MRRNFGMKMLTMTNLSTECLIQLTKLGYDATPFNQIDRKSGSAGMPRPTSYAVFCLKKKRKATSVNVTTYGPLLTQHYQIRSWNIAFPNATSVCNITCITIARHGY